MISNQPPSPNLCVDLDGTLVKTDLLHESLLALIKKSLLSILYLPIVFLKGGRSGLKRYIALRVILDPRTLPYNEDLIVFLKEEKSSGRKLILASASDELLVGPVAHYLNIFDEVIGSTGAINLKGARKAQALVDRFGEKGFDYAGNELADIEIWKRANSAIIVNNQVAFIREIEKSIQVRKVFMKVTNLPSLLVRAIRVHQWVKNLLLFVPPIMAHKWHDANILIQATVSFFSFSLCASSVYIINDLLDLESDRGHPTKKNRPFASGELPISYGMFLVPLLLGLSGVLSLWVGGRFPIILGVYFLITTLYSLLLKRIVLVDIITLASLYSIRILAGAIATSVAISQWLLAFSMFIFFSLACVKRYSELLLIRREEKKASIGRGYVSDDLESISQFGASSGYISILVLALYINSEEVRTLYGEPHLLWLICPLFFYWISRVWLLASRNQMHDDPIVFALRDKTSYVVGALLLICILFSL